MKKIKCLIVDDEALARQIVKNYVKTFDSLQLIDECENGFEAIKALQENEIDLMFLDIQMPKINGFELLEVLDSPPEIIFTTAYDEYAINAFEKNAVDYLLKPFSKERFETAINRATERLQLKVKPEPPKIEDQKAQTLERVVVKKGSSLTVIPVQHIEFIEAKEDFVLIQSREGRFLKDKTMKFYEQALPDNFVRVHRSYIVPVEQIENMEQFGKESYALYLKCGEKVKASANGYKRLREKL